MKSFFSLLALLMTIFVLSPKLGRGQVLDTIRGCDDFPLNTSEISSCTLCDTVTYYGTTAGHTQSSTGRCYDSTRTDQFIGFITGPTYRITFKIKVLNSRLGKGITITGFTQQGGSSRNHPCTYITGDTTLTFRGSYGVPNYLRIDGVENDVCDFTIKIVSDHGADGLGQFITSVQGQESTIKYYPNACEEIRPLQDTVEFNGCEYSKEYHFQPDTFPIAIQSFNNIDNFQRVTWPDSMPQRVVIYETLSPINSSAGNCIDTIVRPFYSHFLDLTSDKKLRQTAWDCYSGRLVGTVQTDSWERINLLASGIQTYTISAAGFHGYGDKYRSDFLSYVVRTDEGSVTTGILSDVNILDTFTVNHEEGNPEIRFHLTRDWNTEIALELLGDPGLWSMDDLYAQRTQCSNLDVNAYIPFSPNFGNIVLDSNYLEFELISSTLTDSNGIRIPTSPVIRRNNLSPRLNIDSIALGGTLAPGNYTFSAVVQPKNLSLICGRNDPFNVTYEFTILDPNAVTIHLPDTMLTVRRDSLVLFTSIFLNNNLTITEEGTYSTVHRCTTYIQTVLAPPANVNLGTLTLCQGECVFTPTGEFITCEPDTFTFLATNDTIYFGDFIIDYSEKLELQNTQYFCDPLSGQWVLVLDWTGSRPPYVLDGQTFSSPFGQAGPFLSGQTIEITLAGASSCVDTLFINGSYSCISTVSSVQTLGFEIQQLSSSLLEITAPSYGWEFHLIDILGREVLATPLQQNKNQLYVGNLLQGTYFMVVQNGNQLASEKWVKR